MSQIEELQSRITAAMDRISQGLEMRASGGDGGLAEELEALKAQLEDEKTVSAQLEERNKRMKDKLDAAEEYAKQASEDERARLKKLDDDLQSLRRANSQLRDNNKALREANQAGVAEPHLINKAMLAELEGLRAARNADRAEADVVLGELTRLLNGADGDSKREDA